MRKILHRSSAGAQLVRLLLLGLVVAAIGRRVAGSAQGAVVSPRPGSRPRGPTRRATWALCGIGGAIGVALLAAGLSAPFPPAPGGEVLRWTAAIGGTGMGGWLVGACLVVLPRRLRRPPTSGRGRGQPG